MTDVMQAETVWINGDKDDQIEAYAARLLDQTNVGGVVVIHHMPGYDESTKEITRRFAANGYAAICPNLYSRDAPGASSDDAAAIARSKGGPPDDRVVGDIAGSIRYLKALSNANQKVGIIGYCSGGRHAFLAACKLPIDAAIDCYGGRIVDAPPPGSELKIGPILQWTKDLSCPLLGLFGADDQSPSPALNSELEDELKKHRKRYEFHTYEGAGHSFFSVDRPAYRPEVATRAWDEIWKFFGTHLS